MKIFILLLLIILSSCNTTKEINNSNFVMIANPFVECASLKEAEKLASFSISLPKELNNKDLIYRVLNTGDKMIEIIQSSDNEKITIRKSKSTEDISGVYKSFDVVKKIIVDDKEVLIKGEKDIFEVAVWINNGFSYSISSNDGFPLNELQALIKQIK